MQESARFLSKHGLPQKIGFRTFLQVMKLLRNTLTSWLYCKFPARGVQSFLTNLSGQDKQRMLCVISFNLPWAVDLMIRSCDRFLPGWQLAIFDNSSDKAARTEIAEICARYGTPYLALPLNPEWSPNRSHSLALNWVYKNVISVVRPLRFGFLDHDCFPTAHPSIDVYLDKQQVYGPFRPSKVAYGTWNLWVGYLFFCGSVIERFRLDFSHDQLRRLDTGGRNWRRFYRYLDLEDLSFSDIKIIDIPSSDGGNVYQVQRIDDVFYHIGGASYRNYGDSPQGYPSTVCNLVEDAIRSIQSEKIL